MNQDQNKFSEPAEVRDNRCQSPGHEAARNRQPQGTNAGGALPVSEALAAAAEIEPEANSGKEPAGLSSLPPADFIEHQRRPHSPLQRVTSSPSARAGDDNAEAEGFNITAAPSPVRAGNFSVPAKSFTATDDELKEANERKTICEKFLELTRDGGYSLNQAAAACGKSPSWFSGATSMLARYQRDGLAGLLPARPQTTSVGELTSQIEALKWFLPAAQFFYLLTNRTNVSGSVPEAIRRVISLPNLPVGWTNTIKNRFLKKLGLTILPVCPDVLRETILAREKSGQAMVPDRIHKAITRAVNSAVIEQYRRPHETGLNYLQAPGTMMFLRNRNGTQEFARAGDILEADDGSINFPVCIPWTSAKGGLISETPCSAKFGVIVGRFQWLRTIDAATRFRPGWVFVARQRGGFRGADVLTLMHGITLQHGAWEEYRFERGVFKSNLVKRAVELLGSRLHTVISPHSKPFIEGGFNQDWTKLSVHFPQCDIGRYAGDTEEANKVVQACKQGRQDPRRLFPLLADALRAFAEITAEENRTLVKSRNSGQWVPEERWARETGGGGATPTGRPLRKVEEAQPLQFAPYAMEWKVKGMLVGGRVPIFEDMSVPFDFSAPYLHEFNGAKVRLHFDPTAHKCFATPVLLQDWQGHRAGEVLPPLQQINETTGYIRMVMGWGEDIGTAGLKAKQQSAVAMRREVRTIMPGGKAGYTRSEQKSLESHGIVDKELRTVGKAEPQIAPMDADAEKGNSHLRQSASSAVESLDRRAAQRAEIEKFERENQHLLV